MYTRYADDLALSARSYRTLASTSWFVRRIVESEGFRLNDHKTRFAGPSRCRKVTGLVVNELDIGVGRRRYRRLRAQIHRACSGKNNADEATVNHINGWLAYVYSVDAVCATRLAEYVGRLASRFPGSIAHQLVVPNQAQD